MININLREELSCSGKNCFDDNFFTNSLNGDIAHLSYKGLATEQNPNIIYPFNTLMANVRPSRIIEIGTFYGGFTLILRALLHNNMLYDSQIVTYDVNHPDYLLSLINDSSNVVTVWLIPETLERTNLSSKETGDLINVEVDVLAKYVERLLAKGGNNE